MKKNLTLEKRIRQGRFYEDEIIEIAIRENESTVDAVWWAIQQEREQCARVCQQVFLHYRQESKELSPEAKDIVVMVSELSSLWIRNRCG